MRQSRLLHGTGRNWTGRARVLNPGRLPGGKSHGRHHREASRKKEDLRPKCQDSRRCGGGSSHIRRKVRVRTDVKETQLQGRGPQRTPWPLLELARDGDKACWPCPRMGCLGSHLRVSSVRGVLGGSSRVLGPALCLPVSPWLGLTATPRGGHSLSLSPTPTVQLRKPVTQRGRSKGSLALETTLHSTPPRSRFPGCAAPI